MDLRARLLLVVVLAGSCVTHARAQQSPPSLDALGTGQKPPSEAISLARADVAATLSPDQIVTGLQKLIQQNADKPARIYVLLDIAADAHLSRTDYRQAWKCLKDLSSRFNVSFPQEALPRFTKAAVMIPRDRTRRRVAAESLFFVVDALVDESIAAADYTGAEQACELMGRLAKTAGGDKASDSEPFLQVARLASLRLAGARRAETLADKAREKLKGTPADPDAHETIGLQCCLYKSDWRTGLDHLKKSGGETVRRAAARELQAANGPQTGEAAHAVAQGWAAVSRDERIFAGDGPWLPVKRALIRHEKTWNDKAFVLGFTNDIDRTLALNRRTALQAALDPNPHFVVGTWGRADGVADWVRDFRSDGDVVAFNDKGGRVTCTWRPDTADSVRVTGPAGHWWVCTMKKDGQLLVEEFAPGGKNVYSETYRKRP